MSILLNTATLLCLGVVSGIYLSVSVHDHRVRDLSALQYTAMHQMRDKTFKRVMPWVALGMLGLLAGFALLGAAPGGPRALAVAAVVLLVLDMIFTLRFQLPVNRAIQRWTQDTVPADWQHYRDTWARQHNVRTLLSLLTDACVLAAQMLP